jgi:hypothetical protein
MILEELIVYLLYKKIHVWISQIRLKFRIQVKKE